METEVQRGGGDSAKVTQPGTDPKLDPRHLTSALLPQGFAPLPPDHPHSPSVVSQGGAGACSHDCAKCELQPLGSQEHHSNQSQERSVLGRKPVDGRIAHYLFFPLSVADVLLLFLGETLNQK